MSEQKNEDHMKKLIVFIIGIFMMASCASPSRTMQAGSGNLIDISQNDEEYEVMVLDAGFETWFATTWSPSKDRSQEYYESWNQQYVTEWNFKANRGQNANFFQNQIQYDQTEDYGIAVERKLFYYFRWVESELAIPILRNPPRGGVF